MTITTTKNRINQTADGVQTIFIYDFIVLDASHMFPYFNDVLQVAGFTVNGVGNPAGGDVTFDVAPANGVTVTLVRTVPFTQLVDYIPYDPFPAETHEGALDKLTLITQQIEDSIARSLQLPLSTEAGDLTLPEPIPEHFLQWNAAGDGLINVTLVTIGAIVVTPFTETLLDDPDADTFWATLMATLTKATARASLGAAGLIDANTFSGNNIFNGDNTFNGANILNGINTFNDKAIFNKVIHQQIGSNIGSASILSNPTSGNYVSVTQRGTGITGATQANPVVITAIAHGVFNGDKVTLAGVGGMTEINGTEYTVANVTANTFQLSGIDGTGFTAYTSGGSIWVSITSIETTGEIGTIIYRKFNGVLVLTHDATDLILFNGSNIVTSLGDVATFIEYDTGKFKLINYSKVDGRAVTAVEASDGASMVLLTSVDITTDTATIEFTGLTDEYKRYELHFSNINSSTDGMSMLLHTSSDGGATYDNTVGDYETSARGFSSVAGVASSNGTGAVQILIHPSSLGNAAGESNSGIITIHDPTDATNATNVRTRGILVDTAHHSLAYYSGGVRLAEETVNAFRMSTLLGQYSSGSFRLYGIKDA